MIAALARFKRRYEVKKNYGPPFKLFLFIFREASENKTKYFRLQLYDEVR